MNILLMILYWFFGVLFSLLICASIGMFINIIISLLRITRRKENWKTLVIYILLFVVCNGLIFLLLIISGTIGDNTDYKGQSSIIVGLIFPGIFSLSIIPKFVKVALNQTVGDFSDSDNPNI